MRAVFEAVAAELEQQGFVRGCPLNNLAHELSLADPDFRTALAGIFSAWRQAIADKIRADQQAGREQDTDPQRFAALAVATYSGAMSMAKTAQDASVLRDCLAELERVRSTAVIAERSEATSQGAAAAENALRRKARVLVGQRLDDVVAVHRFRACAFVVAPGEDRLQIGRVERGELHPASRRPRS